MALKTNTYIVRTTFNKLLQAIVGEIQTEINTVLNTNYTISFLVGGQVDVCPAVRVVWPNKGGRVGARNRMVCFADVITETPPGVSIDSRINELIQENILEKLGLHTGKVHAYTLLQAKDYFSSLTTPADYGLPFRVEIDPSGFEMRRDDRPNRVFYQCKFEIFYRR